jgi:galactonate dehydratase
MRIVAIETINVEAFSNLVWVRIHTDDGIVGLGETFRNSQAVIAYLHETCAPYLLGKNPLDLERHHADLMSRVVNHFNGFPTRCIEIRGNSAIDLALWDILGKTTNCPLYQLLGGATQERMRIYNTCVGYSYDIRASSDLSPGPVFGDCRQSRRTRRGHTRI